MDNLFKNFYVRVGGVVTLVGVSVVLGLRFGLNRIMRCEVVEGEPVPKFSQAYVKGKRVLVVGGTNGLGLAISKELANNGANVNIVGRSDPQEPTLKFLKADLTTVKAQTELADAVSNPESLDILLFTQGILAPPTRKDNGEGIELDLAVSYISRRVILEKLLERGAKPNRVFIMGFPGADSKIIEDWNGEKDYKPWPQHMNTVTANEALVLGFRNRRPDIPVYGLNPGLIKTGIRANMYNGSGLKSFLAESLIGLVSPSPRQYAKTIVNVIGADSLSKNSVFFNAYGEPIRPSKIFNDRKNVDQIWTDTDKLIQRAKSSHTKKTN